MKKILQLGLISGVFFSSMLSYADVRCEKEARKAAYRIYQDYDYCGGNGPFRNCTVEANYFNAKNHTQMMDVSCSFLDEIRGPGNNDSAEITVTLDPSSCEVIDTSINYCDHR
jgi:hypothetical protein